MVMRNGHILIHTQGYSTIFDYIFGYLTTIERSVSVDI